MSAAQGPQEAQPAGTWTYIDLPTNYGNWAIGIVAFIALAALGTGAYYQFVSQSYDVLALSFMIGGGGVFLVDMIILGIRAYCNRKKTGEVQYHVASWNIGSWQDYRDTLGLKVGLGNGASLTEAFNNKQNYQPTAAENEARSQLFKHQFAAFGQPDFICLQETAELTGRGGAAFKAIIPEGYSPFTYSNGRGSECTILWKSDQFDIIGHAELSYDDDAEIVEAETTVPDTIVLLRDRSNGKEIVVASSHLRGFPLSCSESIRLDRTKPGDSQLRYNLATIDQLKDKPFLTIYAGDFNAIPEICPERFGLLRVRGFTTYSSDSDEPTVYDRNLMDQEGSPRAIKLDYVYANGQTISQISPIALLYPFRDLNRPSDHMPVRYSITANLD